MADKRTRKKAAKTGRSKATKKTTRKATRKRAKPGSGSKKPTKPALELALPEISMVSLDRLKPSKRNARTHTASQVAKIADSITEFGWLNPVIADERGRILAGHGRVMAAKKLKLEAVPVLRAEGLTDAQKRAYVIADNRLAELAGWDEKLLGLELGALRKLGQDLGIVGFTPDEVQEFLATSGVREGKTDPDDAPPVSALPVAQRGDVWSLGVHRLGCGDSTAADVVRVLFEGRKEPLVMVTDPPYGVEYSPKWRQESGLAGKGSAVGEVANDDRADWREAWQHFPGDVAYVWHAGTHAHEVAASLISCRFDIRAQIVWIKPRFAVSRGNYHEQKELLYYTVRGDEDHWNEEAAKEAASSESGDPMQRFDVEHEIAMYGVRKKGTAHWEGGRRQSTVWNMQNLKNETGHGTQKPVEAMRRPIENNSRAGDAVYDPFVGSGTTLIAAEISGRICYAMELMEPYVDVAIQRWQDFTGKEAVLEATGQTFAEVREDRVG